MRRWALATGASLLFIGGCAGVPVESPAALAECPVDDAADTGLSVSVLPIRMPADWASSDTSAPLARRIVVTSTARWYRLSVRTVGGTVEGWTRIEAGDAWVEAGESAPAARGRVLVDSGKGSLTVTRPLEANDKRTTSFIADVVLLPGGVPVDEPVLRIRELWDPNGGALAPDAVRIDLEPVRHVPGFDAIEAEFKLDYVQRDARTRVSCRGSAQTRATLADKDAVRPPLWDLGVSTMNQPRDQWLGLRDTSSGVFRAVFDSPNAATSFANWIRATHATRAGQYDIGLFQRDGRALRPMVPVDRGAPQTFSLITEAQQQRLRVGPLGGP